MAARQAIDWWLLTVPLGERIARARILYSHHALVRIWTDGLAAWGCAPLYARAPHQVRKLRPRLEELAATLALSSPAEARSTCARELAGTPDLLCALDGALWELEALREGRAVMHLLGAGEPTPAVEITEQLFADAAADPGSASPALREHGTRALKVKVCGGVESVLRTLQRLRDAVGPEVRLRIDANRGYDVGAAERMAEGLLRLGIEEWEEPVAADFETIAGLRSSTGLRVILDESVRSAADLEEALDRGALDVLNLKLSRLGGITAALTCRRLCEDAGVAVLLGCNEDLGPAMAAVLHASAAWAPFETEGLGWPRLGVDIGMPSPEIVDGCVRIGDAPGWGIDVGPNVVVHGAVAGRRPPRLVHASRWSRSYAALSVVRRQRQRGANAVLRAGLAARQLVPYVPARRAGAPKEVST